MKKIISWLNADNISNDMGGGTLISFSRYFFMVAVVLFFIAYIIFKNN